MNLDKDNFEVRDSRKKEMFRVDDEYLNGYSKLCGTNATLVYLCLCRHADRNQESFPSVNGMAEKLGIGRMSVIRGISTLIDWNIISKIRERRKDATWLNNRYILLDKSVWNPKPSTTQGHGVSKYQIETIQVPNEGGSQVPHVDTKVTHKKETHTKETHLGASPPKKGVKFNPLGGEVLKAFEVVDPKNKTYYGNTTQRGACDFLIAEYGLEKVVRAIGMLPAINQQKLYIRQITSPYELKENWVKIANALAQKKNDTKFKVAF